MLRLECYLQYQCHSKTLLSSFLAGGIRAGLPAKRNVVCLEENDTQLRKSAAMITTAAAVQEQGKEDHEIEEEEDGEVPTEDEKD